jgi:hypothetical protein
MSQFARPNPTNGQPTDPPGTLPGAANVNGVYLIDPVSGQPISPSVNPAENPGSTAFPITSRTGPYSVTLVAVDQVIVPANTLRRFIQIQNQHASNTLYVAFGQAAYTGTAYQGFTLAPGASLRFDVVVPLNELHIAGPTGTPCYVMEG